MRACDSKQSYADALASLQQAAQEMRINTQFDLVLLEELEANHADKAKSVIARRVASYYHTFHESKFLSPQTHDLIECIEANQDRLPTLHEALQKEQQ